MLKVGNVQMLQTEYGLWYLTIPGGIIALKMYYVISWLRTVASSFILTEEGRSMNLLGI